jgi:hypothetical protein
MERRAALGALLTGGAGLWGLLRLGRHGEHGRLRFPEEAAAAVDGLVLGSSVARAALDPAGLPGRWSALCLQGSQPAHWLALLRHQVFAAGARPAVVLLYAPLHSLLGGPLADPYDQALLIDLLSEPDEALIAAALPQAFDPWERLHRGRVRARRLLLEGLGHALPALLLPAEAVVAASAAAPLPADPDAAFATVPGAPTAGRPPAAAPPLLAPEESLLPALQAACAAQGAQLQVVAPARRRPACAPGPRERSLVDWLAAQGIPLIDLGGEALAPDLFDTDWHPNAAGKAAVTARLAAALGGDRLRCGG